MSEKEMWTKNFFEYFFKYILSKDYLKLFFMFLYFFIKRSWPRNQTQDII